MLESLPVRGDECDWGPFHFKVLDVPLRGQLLIELTMPHAGADAMIASPYAWELVGMLLSAFFSGSETGFYRATRLRLVLDAMAGDRVARGLLFLTNHPALFVATALVGNTVASYMISLATVIAIDRAGPSGPAGGRNCRFDRFGARRAGLRRAAAKKPFPAGARTGCSAAAAALFIFSSPSSSPWRDYCGCWAACLPA